MEQTQITMVSPAIVREDLEARFERVFREHQRPIATYLLRLVNNPQQAEELAQDAFVKAYRALGDLPPDANERAWLYRIATNTGYDALRRRKLIQWLPLKPTHRAERPGRGMEDRAIQRDAVQQALAELSPLYRVPLVLFSVEGFSTKEIAEMLQVSVNTVKVRIYRARQKFQEVYQEDVA
jgi:RNA polymerase sigma-70 factor (ECF subfamily)